MKAVYIERFTKTGSSTCWYKINDKLYCVLGHADSPLHKYVDEIYRTVGVQDRELKEIGKIGRGKTVLFEPDRFGYTFWDLTSKIAANPKHIHDGFGVDCLLGNKINSKSILLAEGKPVRIDNGLISYEFYNSNGKLIKPQNMLSESVDISEYFNPNSPSYGLLKNMRREDLIPALGRVKR